MKHPPLLLILLVCMALTSCYLQRFFCVVGSLFPHRILYTLIFNMFINVLKPRQNIRHFPILAVCVLISFLFVFFLVYNSTVKQSKKIDPGQSRTWKDLLVSLFNPRKIFTIRQDLPKRLNFAYFWARTRIVQRGCMVRTLVCFTNTMH